MLKDFPLSFEEATDWGWAEFEIIKWWARRILNLHR
jgi:hypothetical protein